MGSHRTLRAVVGLGLAFIIAGCSVEPDLAQCDEADPTVVSSLEATLTDGDALTDVFQVPSDERPDLVFVSGQTNHRDESGELDDSDGEILTWSFDGSALVFEAVDRHAREISTSPPSADDVRSDGAIESRACVQHA